MSGDVDPGRQVTTGGAGDLGRRVLPVLLLVVAIAMQAGVQGTLTTRIDPGRSLLFTAVAFLTATVVFGGLDTAGRRRPGSRLAAAPRPDRQLMVALNAATAVTFLAFYVSLSLVPASTTSALEAAFGPVCVLLLTRRFSADAPTSRPPSGSWSVSPA